MWKSLVITADERIILSLEVLKSTEGNFSSLLGQLFWFFTNANLTLKNMAYNFKKYRYHLIFAFLKYSSYTRVFVKLISCEL